jgi:hypothetical protein
MIFSAAAMAVVGCSGASSTIKQSKEEEHIRKVAGFVSQYTAATKKQPANIQEVCDWAVKEGKAAEADFSSTRDKEPYGIAFQAMTGVVVFEQKGMNGKCYIQRMGGVSEVSAEDAQRLAKENPQRDPSGRAKKTK